MVAFAIFLGLHLASRAALSWLRRRRGAGEHGMAEARLEQLCAIAGVASPACLLLAGALFVGLG